MSNKYFRIKSGIVNSGHDAILTYEPRDHIEISYGIKEGKHDTKNKLFLLFIMSSQVASVGVKGLNEDNFNLLKWYEHCQSNFSTKIFNHYLSADNRVVLDVHTAWDKFVIVALETNDFTKK